MRRIGNVGLAIVIVGSLTTAAVAQDASSLLSSGMLGWQDNAVSDLISGTDITGYIDTSYTFNFNDDAAAENPGRVFDSRHNETALNGFALDFNRGTSDDSPFGYHVTTIFGDDASVVNAAAGAGDVFSGDDYSLTNLNVSINLDTLMGLENTVVTVGRFEKTVGTESIHSPMNDNFSRGMLFGLAGPLTHTGVLAEKSGIGGRVNARLGWVNGWDTINDGNNAGTLLVGADLDVTEFLSLDLDAVYGPEGGSVSNKRTLVDLVATITAPDDVATGGMEYLKNVSMQLNTVWGQEQGVAGQTVDWYGFSAGMRYDFDLPVLGGDGNSVGRWFLALRGEWFEDPDGARHGAGLDHANLWGVTGTLGFRPAKVLLIRLEMRHDHGQTSGAGSGKPFSDGGRNAQTTVGLNVVANL